MITAKLSVDISIYAGLKLERGGEFVMAGSVMNQLSKIYPGSIEETFQFDNIYNKLVFNELTSEDNILLFRSGGIGDVMFMLPLVKHIHETVGCKVSVASSPMYCDVLTNNPHISEIFQMPFSTKKMKKFNKHLMFEGIIEDHSSKSMDMHSVDLFLEEAGVNFKEVKSSEKIPEIWISQGEHDWIKKKLNFRLKGSRPYIGIQVESSSPIRSFPLDKTILVARSVVEKLGGTVFFFGGKRQDDIGRYLSEMFAGDKNYVNLIPDRLSLRESMLYTAEMDCMVAPDSAFIHIAGGLGIPVVGLYGCFPSLFRMLYYKNAIGVDCNVVCAPSFIHGHSPCDKGFPSPCFSVITVENVIDAINHLLRNKDLSLVYPTYNEFKDGELVKSPFTFARQ